ncbi:MAG: glycoside hydrolase family 88 protein [Bacteroidales bacterium]|nr:MAG: glycoside hydrolase family 88 protein [Bacteroidales bacterium]
MKRRNFILKSSAFGSAFLFTPLRGTSELMMLKSNTSPDKEVIEKVKLAMLSMQRASWEQGVAAQAFLESDEEDMVVLMAGESVLRQTEEGRLAVLYHDNGVTDPAASGEAVLHAAKLSGDEKMKAAADKMLEYLLERAPKNSSGILYHTINAPQIWVDSLYMAPPFLATAGYFKESIKQIKGIKAALWNPGKKLYSHIWDDGEKTFINKKFWGVGNGWAATGMARVVKALPDDMQSEKEELITYIKEVIDGCLEYIRSDNLFHNVVDDSSTFVETNLSQMLSYTIFSGIKNNWLHKDYLEYAYRMRDAAYKKVDKYGYVQGVCGAPYFDKPGRATEGQAFFLLMEAAYNKLVRS